MVEIRRYAPEISQQVRSPTPARGGDDMSGMQALAGGLQDVSDTAFIWQDEIDTADAKSADAAFTEQVNDLLYNDQTGFMYQTGSGAINGRGEVGTAIDRARDDIMGKLSPSARRKAETALQARYESATQRINQHAAGERRTYLNSASEARITSSLNSALADPGEIDQQLSVAMREIDDLAARNGWAPEVTALKRAEATDQVYVGTIERMAKVNPQSALDFAAANRDKLSGEAQARVERELIPLARERRGREIGRQAASGGSLAGRNAFTSLIDRTEGAGRYDTLFSHSQRSRFAGVDVSRMTVGEAIAFSRPSGAYAQWVKGQIGRVATPMGRWQIVGTTLRQAARQMGLPDDTPFNEATQDRIAMHLATSRLQGAGSQSAKRAALRAEWEGLKHVSDDQLDAAVAYLESGAGGEEWSAADRMQSIMTATEGRPEIRDAALREFDLYSRQREMAEDEARDGALQAGFAMIEQGGSVADLDVDTRTALGPETLTTLRRLEAARRTGERIETDDAFYVELTQMATDAPDAFMRSDPMEWRMRLDDADFQRFVAMQAQMKTETRNPSTPSGRRPVAASTLMTTAKRQMEAAGLDSTPDAGSDDAAAVARMQSRLIRWQEQFIETEGRTPTQTEMNDRIGRELTEVTINPPGWRNEYEGPAVGFGDEIDDPDRLSRTDFTIGGVVVPPEVIVEQVRAMENAGEPVTAEVLMERLIFLLERAGQL